MVEKMLKMYKNLSDRDKTMFNIKLERVKKRDDEKKHIEWNLLIDELKKNNLLSSEWLEKNYIINHNGWYNKRC